MHEVHQALIFLELQIMALKDVQKDDYTEAREAEIDKSEENHEIIKELWEEIQKNQASIVQGRNTFREEHTEDKTCNETDSCAERQVNIRL